MKNQTSNIRSLASSKTRPHVLALSSGGGHWVQLLRLRPAFKDCDVTYATVNRGYEPEVEGAKFRTVIDSNRNRKLKLVLSLLSIAWIILRIRPDTVISTGAAPGFFAILIGKLLGKRTIWIDSIANAEELSMSGQKAGKYATHWLTQWEQLAKPEGPHCYGNVLGEQSSQGDDQLNPIHNQQSAMSNKNPEPFRIFVTVGTDQHFDRMVKIIDQWAANNPAKEVFAQIGDANYQPSYIEHSKFLAPQEFVSQVESASLIIAHAGMGTILTALKHQKPILVMPKLASLGEHRNEHQTATAKHLSSQGKVNVVFNERSLLENLDNLDKLTVTSKAGTYASTTLTNQLKALIQN